jgi:FkbM family methyltransferase
MTPVTHHPVFSIFDRPGKRSDETFFLDFLGVKHRKRFLEEALIDSLVRWSPRKSPSEEYFEWIALLVAVEAAPARFTIVEVGAGWGRWMLRGAAAAKLRNKSYHLVGVEPDPDHFNWMAIAMDDNDIPPGNRTLIHGVVAGTQESVWFQSGTPSEWYGQAIIEAGQAHHLIESGAAESTPVRQMRPISLDSTFAELESVDLLDLDIQGAEADAIEQSIDSIERKVKAVYVSTHSEEVERRLRALFLTRGWFPVFDYSLSSSPRTPYGTIQLKDGAQLWMTVQQEKMLRILWEPWMATNQVERMAEEIRQSAANRSELRRVSIELLKRDVQLAEFQRRVMASSAAPAPTAPLDAEAEVTATYPGEYRLDDIRSHHALLVSKTKPVRITTGEKQWSYAVSIPYRRGSGDGPVRIRILGTVETGSIGLGVLTPDRTAFVREVSAGAGIDETLLELVIDSQTNCGDLVVRNRAADGSSVFVLQAIHVDSVPADSGPGR